MPTSMTRSGSPNWPAIRAACRLRERVLPATLAPAVIAGRLAKQALLPEEQAGTDLNKFPQSAASFRHLIRGSQLHQNEGVSAG